MLYSKTFVHSVIKLSSYYHYTYYRIESMIIDFTITIAYYLFLFDTDY